MKIITRMFRISNSDGDQIFAAFTQEKITKTQEELKKLWEGKSDAMECDAINRLLYDYQELHEPWFDGEDLLHAELVNGKWVDPEDGRVMFAQVITKEGEVTQPSWIMTIEQTARMKFLENKSRQDTTACAKAIKEKTDWPKQSEREIDEVRELLELHTQYDLHQTYLRGMGHGKLVRSEAEAPLKSDETTDVKSDLSKAAGRVIGTIGAGLLGKVIGVSLPESVTKSVEKALSKEA